MTIERSPWGRTPDGEAVHRFDLRNGNGMSASIATYGGAVLSLTVPDKNGEPGEVLLGFDDLAGYLNHDWYSGCLVGRVANRIQNASITLGGETFQLDRNHGKHQLHGGAGGFNTRVWRAAASETPDGPELRLMLTSPHLDQGYPGEMRVSAVYALRPDNTLVLTLSAVADRPSVVNLTNHMYFHLGGEQAVARGEDCTGHVLEIMAGHFLPTDGELIPTGEIAPVAGTPLDFTSPRTIGERVGLNDELLRAARGYDHCMVLDQAAQPARGLTLAARVLEPSSGRRLELSTDMEALQFYSGNFLSPGTVGRNGAIYGFRTGFCLEPQAYVDAPHHPAFPSIAIDTGETYRRRIEYCFSAA